MLESGASRTEDQKAPNLETEALRMHKLTVKEFAGSRSSQERMVQEWKEEIEEKVREACPLDFFPQQFEIVDWKQLQAILARDVFPRRYEHWSFGQKFASQDIRDMYGLGRTYELVINTDPCVAYLLDSNSVQETRTVMAHVYFHNTFFKHNAYFRNTDRKMLARMGNHAERIREYQRELGPEVVERFLDRCLSIDNLIDPHSVFIQRDRGKEFRSAGLERQEKETFTPNRIAGPEYMQRFLNPPEILQAEVERNRAEQAERQRRLPVSPEQDVLLFLMKYAPLEDWQRDILSMVRDESYYFAPQRMTKIMNEGWASYWHSKLMTQHLLPLYPSEMIDYCDFNAMVLAPSRKSINPYRLGVRLFRDIEERWNKGQFGREWEACRDMTARRMWDKNTGLGVEEMVRAMRTHNDLTFLDTYLTADFCAENQMYLYEKDKAGNAYVSSDEFDEIRQYFRKALTNFGEPKLSIVNANHANRGELFLAHQFEGVELDLSTARMTTMNLESLWGRPVHVLSAKEDGTKIVLSCDGGDFSVDKARPLFIGQV